MKRVMKAVALVLVGAGLGVGVGGCGSAAGSIPTGDLGVTARDAYVEARSIARSWAAGARLRYVEGEEVSPTGMVLPGTGQWLFHYTASGQSGELLVRVTALETGSEERAATSPPGYVVGDNALGASWIDSPEAMGVVLAARADEVPASASLLLVPTRPEQWVVRFPASAGERWRVHAETGEVLGS